MVSDQVNIAENVDGELTMECAMCRGFICNIEHGDSLESLFVMAESHLRHCGNAVT